MTIYKIKYILDMDEDYYMFFDDAIEAGKNYIDKIAMEEKDGWDCATITYAKNCVKDTLAFKGGVKIKAVKVHTRKEKLKRDE